MDRTFATDRYRNNNLPDYSSNFEPHDNQTNSWNNTNYSTKYLDDSQQNKVNEHDQFDRDSTFYSDYYDTNNDRNFLSDYNDEVENIYDEDIRSDYEYDDEARDDLIDKDYNNLDWDGNNYYVDDSYETAIDVPVHDDKYYDESPNSRYDIHKMRDRNLINSARSTLNNDIYTLDELRTYANDLGLQTSGNKNILIARILEDRRLFDL